MGCVKRSDFKIFKDNVHGYIKIPIDFVCQFIDTDVFQRLRNIEQTGMRTLYPSARHDRFIHSLGTYHLGTKAFDNFRMNVKDYSAKQTDSNRKHYNVLSDDKNEIFWDKCDYLFRIACLLHDCGHAPFSHTLEFLYEYPSKKTTLREKLKQYLATQEFRDDFKAQGTQHEIMSALVVCVEFWSQIEKIIKDNDIEVTEDKDDVEFVARMIIGCKYSRDSKINRIKNCLISLLNSNSIDVDSLDYIVRDSKLSGIDNMSVDVDRLLSSLTIVEKTMFKDANIRNASIKTNILNGKLRSFEDKKASIDGHFRGVSRLYDVSGKMQGSISASGNLKINNRVRFVKANNNIIKVGSGQYDNEILEIKNETNVELFGVTNDFIDFSGSYLEFRKEFNGKIAVESSTIELDSTFVDGKMGGKFTGELLGCYNTLNNGKLTCELGFYKSSLSVVQNVLIARNYEYQWIYSHHKVVYYSNYLVVDLFRECIKYILSSVGENEDKYEDVWTSIMSWETMVKDDSGKIKPFVFSDIPFLRPTDSDIMALFKKCYAMSIVNCDNKSKCAELLREYYTRNYKKSLWKSYAEFEILFSDFSNDEKRKLLELFKTYSTNQIFDQYGYLDSSWESEFNSFGMKNVVWVNGDSKLKALNPDSTSILFSDDIILNYRTVAIEKDIQTEQKLMLFYLYYNIVDGYKQVDKDKMKLFLRDKLKEFI